MQEKARERSHEIRESMARTVWRRRIAWLFSEVIWGCGAWLLGQAQMWLGTYPLGMAMLCAAKKHTLSILIGLIASAFWQMQQPVIYICAYIAAAVIRVVSAMILDIPEARIELPEALRRKLGIEELADGQGEGEAHPAEGMESSHEPHSTRTGISSFKASFLDLFGEGLRLRMATAAACAFILALYRIIAGGFRYYDLFAAIFVLLITPAAVAVYSVWLGGREERRVAYRISQSALLFSIVWAASPLTVFADFSLSAMLALFFTLYACAFEGTVAGVAASAICGVAHDPIHAPAFLLAALTFSFFKGLRRENAGVLLACLSAVVWSAYVGGVASLITLVPASLIAGSVFTLWLRFRQGESIPTAQTDDPDLRMRMEDGRHRDSNERFRGISDAFSSLSEMFYNLSDRFRRPGTLDLRRICDASFDAFCPDCPNKSICWGLEYSDTMKTMSALISALHTKGKVTRKEIPSALSHRCDSVEAILEHINSECAKLTAEMLRNNRTEIFAMDYESAASIINDALEEDDGEYRFDPALEQRIAEYLSDAGIRAHSVTVYGKRRRQILLRGVDLEQATVTVETLRADLGELCGLELASPIFEMEGNSSMMTFRAKKKISVISAQNNISADSGVSGDCINQFSNKKDYFYALINDGMGAGREAALTSNLCSVFLEKMLRAGNRAGTSLRMLNNMIRSRGADSTNECSSTVDLLELDLMTAEASFIKSGAAPSFVVRGKTVHRLQSGTAPIGIICALDVQTTPFGLHAGDTVVMISDGILQDDPECEWLTSYLSAGAALTPEEIVYHICLHAAENDRHDDCSAVAVRILAAEE